MITKSFLSLECTAKQYLKKLTNPSCARGLNLCKYAQVVTKTHTHTHKQKVMRLILSYIPHSPTGVQKQLFSSSRKRETLTFHYVVEHLAMLAYHVTATSALSVSNRKREAGRCQPRQTPLAHTSTIVLHQMSRHSRHGTVKKKKKLCCVNPSETKHDADAVFFNNDSTSKISSDTWFGCCLEGIW